MKKPSIPTVTGQDTQLAAILTPMKQSIEIMTGARGGALDALPSNASLADVITKINSIIYRLNA